MVSPSVMLTTLPFHAKEDEIISKVMKMAIGSEKCFMLSALITKI